MDIRAYFKISYGLYIISSGNENTKNGYVGNTAFQLTAEPAQFAISSNKDNHTTKIIEETGKFSISILKKETDSKLIGLFGYQSGKVVEKFESVKHITGKSGVPVVLEDTIAYFECKLVKTMDVGTHIVFVGEVVNFELIEENEDPLTYDYYRNVKKGFSPKNAPTYIDKSKIEEQKKTDVKTNHRCEVCNYVYDPAENDGVAFEDLPDDYGCPICGAGKEDFIAEKTEEQASKTQQSQPKTSDKNLKQCMVCGYEYDSEKGDSDSGIAPGTPFEDLPDDWKCPVCGVEKSEFD